jgi:hypothetical protein
MSKRESEEREEDKKRQKRVGKPLTEVQKEALAEGRRRYLEAKKTGATYLNYKERKKLERAKKRAFIEDKVRLAKGDTHQEYIKRGITKQEGRRIIAELKVDFGLTKKKPSKRHISTNLPPLTNPLPVFLRKGYAFFKRRTQQHFGKIAELFEPVVNALGIVPAGNPIFSIFVNELVKRQHK